MKLIDLLAHSVAISPNKNAMVNSDVQIEYEKMLLDVHKLSRCLKSAGCRSGVKTAIVLDNCPEYLVSFFAISAAGGIIVPLSSHMTDYEVARYIKRADVSIVISKPAYKQRTERSRASVLFLKYNDDGNLQIESETTGKSEADDKNIDVAMMVPTSGTVGPSKFVLLKNSQLISNMIAYRHTMRFDGGNVIYCATPLHHIYTICAQILTHISLADTFVLNEEPFFIKDFLRAVEEYKVTGTAFVPSMAILMAEFPIHEQANLSSLEFVTISGAKMPALAYRRLVESYKHTRFINTYGMTEAGSRISLAAPSPEKFPIESVGKTIPGVKVRIVMDGKVLPANSQGCIEVQSSGVMKGYYRQEKLTAITLRDGWLNTGDIGQIDSEGNLYVLGRSKDIIVTGGTNIYPSEIEASLLEHPAVRQAVVVGQKDKLLQEVPCAFLVRKKGYDCKIPTDIMSFCRRRLSSYKIPRSQYFLEELPLLNSSKPDRRALKKMADELSQESKVQQI